MARRALLISPLATGAYFDDAIEVSQAEASFVLPDGVDLEAETRGGMTFLVGDMPDDLLGSAVRLSFVQGAFEVESDSLTPIENDPGFALPEAFVTGARYQGKTHPLVTQLALNLALVVADTGRAPRSLLDPLAGRGTTLLWAVSYGLDAVGIEIDAKAPQDLHRHIKAQTKFHRVKHRHDKGFVAKKGKGRDGAFVRYAIGGQTLRLITGDSRNAPSLLHDERVDVVVTDLPYGVQFHGTSGESLIDLVRECAPSWVESLRPGGAMSIIFNTYRPKRVELEELFGQLGCEVIPFSAPHRMSESIVRDIVVVKRLP